MDAEAGSGAGVETRLVAGLLVGGVAFPDEFCGGRSWGAEFDESRVEGHGDGAASAILCVGVIEHVFRPAAATGSAEDAVVHFVGVADAFEGGVEVVPFPSCKGQTEAVPAVGRYDLFDAEMRAGVEETVFPGGGWLANGPVHDDEDMAAVIDQTRDVGFALQQGIE